ncbi:MAG: hypothetical protein IK080_03130 [Clostridia bacterium]|nr:hypothetical protein [Clostridia bacterium]
MQVIDAVGLRLGLDLPAAWIDPAFRPFFCEGKPDAIVRFGDPDVLERTGGETYEMEEIVTVWPDAVRMRYREPGIVPGTMLRLDRPVPEIIAAVHSAAPEPFTLMDAVKGSVYWLLQMRGVYVLHSASVLLDGRVYAFSALSGTGKTTHAALWRKVFAAEDFNGDQLAIRAGECPVTAYGLPWCGSSGVAHTGAFPLGGVFFLERGDENRAQPVEGLEKLVLLSQRMVADHFTPGALVRTMNDLAPTAQALPCARLRCRMDDDAARVAVDYARRWMRQGERNDGKTNS